MRVRFSPQVEFFSFFFFFVLFEQEITVCFFCARYIYFLKKNPTYYVTISVSYSRVGSQEPLIVSLTYKRRLVTIIRCGLPPKGYGVGRYNGFEKCESFFFV